MSRDDIREVSEEEFQSLANVLWFIAEQEVDGDHIQGILYDLGNLYKWYGEVIRPEDGEPTPEDVRVAIGLAQEFDYEDIKYTMTVYEGHMIPERAEDDELER